MNEVTGFFIALVISFFLFGYYAFLAWFRPERFRAMGRKSLPLYGNSPLMKSWISSKVYIWMARLTMPLAFAACGFLLFAMLRTLIIRLLTN
jgi:hypothetical protein